MGNVKRSSGRRLLPVVLFWRAFSDKAPPKELRKLLERLFCGEGLYLYARKDSIHG